MASSLTLLPCSISARLEIPISDRIDEEETMARKIEREGRRFNQESSPPPFLRDKIGWQRVQSMEMVGRGRRGRRQTSKSFQRAPKKTPPDGDFAKVCLWA